MAWVRFGQLKDEAMFYRVLEVGVWKKIEAYALTDKERYDMETLHSIVNTKPVRKMDSPTYLWPETLVRPLSEYEKSSIHS